MKNRGFFGSLSWVLSEPQWLQQRLGLLTLKGEGLNKVEPLLVPLVIYGCWFPGKQELQWCMSFFFETGIASSGLQVVWMFGPIGAHVISGYPLYNNASLLYAILNFHIQHRTTTLHRQNILIDFSWKYLPRIAREAAWIWINYTSWNSEISHTNPACAGLQKGNTYHLPMPSKSVYINFWELSNLSSSKGATNETQMSQLENVLQLHFALRCLATLSAIEQRPYHLGSEM